MITAGDQVDSEQVREEVMNDSDPYEEIPEESHPSQDNPDRLEKDVQNTISIGKDHSSATKSSTQAYLSKDTESQEVDIISKQLYSDDKDVLMSESKESNPGPAQQSSTQESSLHSISNNATQPSGLTHSSHEMDHNESSSNSEIALEAGKVSSRPTLAPVEPFLQDVKIPDNDAAHISSQTTIKQDDQAPYDSNQKEVEQPILNPVIKQEDSEVDDAEVVLHAETTTMDSRAETIEPVAPEVEYDSSPYESSSDDSSSDDSDESDDDYEMLDPIEQARRLMEGDGSDDEGGKVATGGQLRTANEKPEEVIPIPDIKITPETKIEELGNIEAILDNMILIKAKTSGEYQVLDNGSVLCSSDHAIIGVVAETIGRVQEPLYCIRFTSAATISGFGLERGKTVSYLPEHSNFVFTKALQAVKGSDASNIHDEEVGRDEIEFSDDEAEAEYKRQRKQQKLERKSGRGGSNRGCSDFGAQQREPKPEIPSTLSYDEPTMDDEMYKPLTRPLNFNGADSLPPKPQDGYSRGPGGYRGRGGFRGRGNDHRGGNHRGSNRGRGNYRGQPNGWSHSDRSPPARVQDGFTQVHSQQNAAVQPSISPNGSLPPQQNMHALLQQFQQHSYIQPQAPQPQTTYNYPQQQVQNYPAQTQPQYWQQYPQVPQPQQQYPPANQWPGYTQTTLPHASGTVATASTGVPNPLASFFAQPYYQNQYQQPPG